MKKFLFMTICAFISGLAIGQHEYYYFDNNVIGCSNFNCAGGTYLTSDGVLTSVVISDYFTTNTYLVSINKEKREISVAQLSGSNPQAFSNYIVNNIQLDELYKSYILNGGFIDPVGDIIVYGALCDGITRDGVIMKLFASSGYTSVDIYYTSEEYKDGCFAYRNGTLEYYFASRNAFVRTKSTAINQAPSGYNLNRKTVNGIRDFSLVYDYSNNYVIVSGCTDDEVILMVYDAEAFNLTTPLYSYRYSSPTNYSFCTKTNAVDIEGNWYYSNSTVYIVQDVIMDLEPSWGGIWLLIVDWSTGIVSSSYTYATYNVNPYINGVANNFDNLFVLGTGKTSIQNKFISQIDLNNLSSCTYRTIWSTALYNSSLYGTWRYSDLLLNNITYDHYTANAIAAGALDFLGCISDSYTLTSTCDYTNTLYINPKYPLNSGNVSTIAYTTAFDSPITKSTYRDVACYLDRKICSNSNSENYPSREEKLEHIRNIIAEKTGNFDSQDVLLKSIKNADVEIIGEDEFVCKDFCDEINYVVYDVVGRVVCDGHTLNGKTNYIRTNDNGLFFIRATDSKGNTKVQKIFIK